MKRALGLILISGILTLAQGTEGPQSPVPQPPQVTNEAVMAQIGQLTVQLKALQEYSQTLIAKINEQDKELKDLKAKYEPKKDEPKKP